MKNISQLIFMLIDTSIFDDSSHWDFAINELKKYEEIEKDTYKVLVENWFLDETWCFNIKIFSDEIKLISSVKTN